ncbi:MAG: ScyD/ScyE family protein [Chloroflexota bacterium]
MRRVLIFCMVVMYFTVIATAQETSEISITQIADGLNNPRGVAVMPNGDLLVVEAGTGSDQPENIVGSGRILQLSDDDDNGYFTDEADTTSVLLDAQPSFNSLAVYRTGHDEPFGLNDIYLMDDGRIFFTRDHPFAEGGRNTGGEGYYGEVGIYQLNLENGRFRTIAQRSATLNALAYHPENELFYATESGFNQIMSTTLDGEVEIVAPMPILANNQQPVPAGIAVDPTTGDVLVALFSGFVYDYFGTQMGFMPGDARVVRVDTETGAVTDEITGLTTAIDVTVDAQGNIYVVELTTVWEPNPMPFDFDLTDDTLPPDPGGYARYTGRVSMLPVGSDTLVSLATGLDMPSNITFHESALYVSIGLGTPQRRVLTPQGIERIDGRIVRITGF